VFHFVAILGSIEVTGSAIRFVLIPAIIGLGTSNAVCPMMRSPFVSVCFLLCIFTCEFGGVTYPSASLNFVMLHTATVGLGDSSSAGGGTEGLVRITSTAADQ